MSDLHDVVAAVLNDQNNEYEPIPQWASKILREALEND